MTGTADPETDVVLVTEVEDFVSEAADPLTGAFGP